jgi:choline dehydrogenase-like flavoprotein
MPGFGDAAAALANQLPNISAIIALLRDGFHDEAAGGTVELKSDTTPLLDYPITAYVWEGARRALHTMADIQFAAGAKSVYPLHENAKPYSSPAEAKAAIDAFPMEILRTRVASAHVMGGCGMGSDPKNSVIQGDGRHHQVENLHVFDGSSFPTSLGVNPQLSIYAMVARNASGLAKSIG